MICCSKECEKMHKCALHINNTNEDNRYDTVEDYYWFGSGSVSANRCETTWACGPHGDWGMFRHVDIKMLKKQRDALDKIIKELEDEYGYVGNYEFDFVQKRR